MTDFNAVIAALSVDAARNILNYTPQLYRRYGSTEPVLVDPLATGVLFKMNNVRFLISAAHVIEENKELGEPNKIGIMIKNVFYNLNGFIKYSASGQHANNERIDLLIWRIDDAEVIADLDARYQFLTPSDLDINYQPFQGANYLIVGFPVSKTKKKIDKKIKAESFIFLTTS